MKTKGSNGNLLIHAISQAAKSLLFSLGGPLFYLPVSNSAGMTLYVTLYDSFISPSIFSVIVGWLKYWHNKA